MLSFIHVDFAVHEVFKWLSQNKGNAFNIGAFDLLCILITSLGFHYAASLIPFFFFSILVLFPVISYYFLETIFMWLSLNITLFSC